MESTSRNSTDFLRTAGALMLAAGAVALFLRKGVQEEWGKWAMLALVLIPAILLYRLALRGADRDGQDAEPSRAVMLIASILLSPLAIGALLSVLGVNIGKPLVTASIFAAAGLIAAFGASRARVPYAALLAGLAGLVAWLIVLGQALEHPKADDFRVFLLIAGGLLASIAYRLSRSDRLGAREVATVAGLALVLAGSLGISVGAAGGLFNPLPALAHSRPTGAGQHFGWDLYLLVVSVALVWSGAHVRSRGLAYVGGLGVVLFIFSIGFQVARIDAGRAPNGSLAGWPLALLILGVLGLIAAALRRDEA